MKIDPKAYNISIRRGTFEGEVLFEARVKELPDLAEYGETYAEAYDLAVDTIETAAVAYSSRAGPFRRHSCPLTISAVASPCVCHAVSTAQWQRLPRMKASA